MAIAVAGPNPAACDFRDTVPAGSGGLLVAAHYRGRAAANAHHGNVNRDSYGGGRDTLRVFGARGAGVLPAGAARQGRSRDRATAGDRPVRTGRTREPTLSARANRYGALAKPADSF